MADNNMCEEDDLGKGRISISNPKKMTCPKSAGCVPLSNLLDHIEIFAYFIHQSKIAALVHA